MQQQVDKQIKTLPFNHNSDDLWQAINITEDEFFEILFEPEKFYFLDEIPKRLRIFSVLVFMVMRQMMEVFDKKDFLPIFLALIYDYSRKRSEIIEVIERNLVDYAINGGVSLEKFNKDLNTLFKEFVLVCWYCWAVDKQKKKKGGSKNDTANRTDQNFTI